MNCRLKTSQEAQSCHKRAALTQIELVVVIGIIGLLVAILLPAVQSVRTSAHRSWCAHRQRQLVLAIANYSDAYSTLPPLANWTPGPLESPESAISRLFPYLELGNLNQIVNAKIDRLSALECPADGEISLLKTPLSYVFNESPGINSGSLAHGPFQQLVTVRMADVTDGLSNTAAVCETLAVRAGGQASDADRNPMRYPWAVFVPGVSATTISNPTSPSSLAERANQTDLSIEDCQKGLRTFNPMPEAAGAQWGQGSFGGPRCSYSHWLPPNTAYCTAASAQMSDIPFLQSSHRSASGHAGGVNMTFLDGHQRFVSDSVDLKVWRAAGTRDGNEANEGL